MKSFIKYYGGKSQMVKEILKIMPKHKTYIESFCGASWLLFSKPKSNIEIINDIDNDLVNLYIVIKNQHEEFKEELQKLPISEKLFNVFRYQQGIPLEDPDKFLLNDKGIVKRAISTYYLIMNSFNGNIANKIHFSIDKNRESGMVRFYKTDWREISERLKTVTINNRDYKKLFEMYDSKDSLFYLDPPYFMATNDNNYYKNTFNSKDHKDLLLYLKELEGKFILNYENTDIVKDYYQKYKMLEFNNELLIYNFELETDNNYFLQDRYTNLAHGGIPKRAPPDIPNCPYCGSRFIQNVSKRVTLEDNRRNWKTCGFICNDCKELFKFNNSIPDEDPKQVYLEDREGIPKGDER